MRLTVGRKLSAGSDQPASAATRSRSASLPQP